MKMKLLLSLALAGVSALVHAQIPTPTYQWDFNMTNSAAGTNEVPATIPGSNVQAPLVTPEGVLQMQNSSGVAVNLLGLPGSGVGTNVFDRAALLNGAMGGSGPIMKSLGLANTLTNLGVVTKCTITAWIKSDSTSISGFPRVLTFGPQFNDIADLNSVGVLFFSSNPTFNSIQFKMHNNSVNGPNGFLSSYLSDWFFLAVTYDSTVDPITETNVLFYVGDRFNPLGAPAGAAFQSPSVNSQPPAATTGPGYLNFSGDTNADGSYSSVSNQVWVTIANRDTDRARAFNGRYDDVRFYANTVLSQAQLNQVRLSAGLQSPERLRVISQPQNTTVVEGQGASFTVTTTPAPNTTYQWYRINPGGGTVSNNIAGATNQTYETPSLTVAADSGAQYGVRIHSTDPFADNGGAGTNSTYALLTVVAPGSVVAIPGMLKFEYFANTGNGVSVDDFLAAPTANYLNNTPNLTAYLPTFDTRNVFPDDTHFNYFVRVTGTITPTETTNYIFYIRAGDQGQLYLSTDGGASSNLICSDAVSGVQAFTGPESTVSSPGGRWSSPQLLTAGTSYPIVAFLKVSSGAQLLQVAWRAVVNDGLGDLPTSDEDIADRLKPIPAGALSTVAPPSGTISISSQPQPAAPSVVANSKVTFNAGVLASLSANNAATANGPVVIQWQKNGVNIPGATGTNYTTPYLKTIESGTTFRVIASIPGASATSSTATVTVSADNVAPTVVSAKSDDSMSTVIVKFSEPVDVATALNPANYSINGGALAVVGVKWAADTNLLNDPEYDAVKLTTALQADAKAYTVTVTGVKDTANNTIAGGNTATFRSYKLDSGFARFEYFEVQTYNSLAGLDVNALVNFSPKFTNNDPDTVVFPTSTEMSPDGTSVIRSSSGNNPNLLPTIYGTRMSTIFVAPETTNYVFFSSGNDSFLLWLSTDANPAHKHVVLWQTVDSGKRSWTSALAGSTATFATNLVDGSSVTAFGATPWPVADANNFAVISLTAGQRYYLELDHLENAGYDSFNAVTYVTAPDNATVTPPANGTAPALSGSVIGWYFPDSSITSIASAGSNVTIAWQDGFKSLNRGALGYPGLGFITESIPAGMLQSASVVTGPYANVTNANPATVSATNSAGFFRIGQ